MKRWRGIGWLLAALLASAPAGAENPPVFYSRAAGFQIKRPMSWHWLTDVEALNNQVPQRLSDAELAKLLGKRPALVLVQIGMHEEPYAGLNPSIEVSIQPLRTLASPAPVEALAPIAEKLKKDFPDLTVIDAPQPATVGGRPGARMKARYTTTLDGKSVQVLERIWLVPRGEFAFLIGASGPAEGPEVAEAAIAGALAATRILK